MNRSLSHLPQQKQEEIQAIADGIRLLVDPAMIILFGSYARGTYVEDSYTEDHITYSYISDYDILVIVEDERRADIKEKSIRNNLRKHLHHELPVQVIVHGIEHVNEALEEGQYFFSDIVKEGVLLYDNHKFQLSNPKSLSAEQRKKISQMYFEKWFPKGEDFLFYTDSGIKDERFSSAIFQLHQATEALLVTVILFHTHYKPKTHDLRQLYKNVVMLDDRFKQVFPLETLEDKRLFEILVKAYIDSRYKMNYKLDLNDLIWLRGRVQVLRELTGNLLTHS